MKISLVVPVYNEEATIENFYGAVKNFDFQCVCEIEIIFIDDDNNIKAMTYGDMLDSIVRPVIDELVTGSNTADQAGTYFIDTSSTATGNTSLVS